MRVVFLSIRSSFYSELISVEVRGSEVQEAADNHEWSSFHCEVTG